MKVIQRRDRKGMGQGGIAYPWLRWFKRGRMLLKYNKHFDCLPSSFRQMARRAGQRLGYNVTTRITNLYTVEIKARKTRR